jgi:argininosuccinate lyase
VSHIRGRFRKTAGKLVTEYTTALSCDRRLCYHDIAGSIAHTRMLAKQGIISAPEAEAITRGLADIKEELAQGRFEFKPELEDIHMSIEARLIEKVGEVGGKLHTARSRNDQIALDLRLFTKEAIAGALAGIKELQQALVAVAEANKKVIMPGYTHLQPAQPVLLAHHLLAYFEMLQRDAERFSDCRKRTDVMPLGSGALAGVAYDIDRDFLARELGFSRVSQNSMDAVSDRDFVVEYEAAASLCMMHLSRLAAEIILWSSAGFDFIELDEAYATASSIMPQKKNPDVAELARGKTGRVYGRLVALLTTMKALPRVKLTGIEAAVRQGYILATDLADYLVRKGESFRTAHDIVGRLVSYAMEQDKAFSGLSLSEYQSFSPRFGEDVRFITVESSLASRAAVGGTAPERVEKALAAAKKMLAKGGP